MLSIFSYQDQSSYVLPVNFAQYLTTCECYTRDVARTQGTGEKNEVKRTGERSQGTVKGTRKVIRIMSGTGEGQKLGQVQRLRNKQKIKKLQ